MNKRISTLLTIALLISLPLLQACGPVIRTGLTDAEKQEMVDAHNRWRNEVGVGSIKWSDTVAEVAQKWAEKLAAQGGQLQHTTDKIYGENLFWGGSQYTPTNVVNSWGNEKACFQNEVFPNIYNGQCDTMTENKCNQNKDWTCAGHYSQMVWKTAMEIGCGMATITTISGGVVRPIGEVWVCNYNPPGNVHDQQPY